MILSNRKLIEWLETYVNYYSNIPLLDISNKLDIIALRYMNNHSYIIQLL